MGWLIPPPWLPNGERPIPSIAIRVPLPGTTFINASNDVELVTPILEGDRLKVVEEVVSVSPEKRTRVGVGHFVETCDSYYREDGVPGRDEPKHVVPLHPCGVAMSRYRRLAWSEITVPTELAEVVDEISYQRVVMNPGATWDYFPGHYDPALRRKPRASNDFRQHDASRGVHRPDRDRLGGPVQPRGAAQGVDGRVRSTRAIRWSVAAGSSTSDARRPVTPCDTWWTSRSRSSTSATSCAARPR